jgi:hypothetical protein
MGYDSHYCDQPKDIFLNFLAFPDGNGIKPERNEQSLSISGALSTSHPSESRRQRFTNQLADVKRLATFCDVGQ